MCPLQNWLPLRGQHPSKSGLVCTYDYGKKKKTGTKLIGCSVINVLVPCIQGMETRKGWLEYFISVKTFHKTLNGMLRNESCPPVYLVLQYICSNFWSYYHTRQMAKVSIRKLSEARITVDSIHLLPSTFPQAHILVVGGQRGIKCSQRTE